MHFSGECIKEEVMHHQGEFKRSYFHWFNALYKDKYYYMGDAELMHAAFLLDIGTYFIGPVRLVYTMQDKEFSKLPYDGPAGTFFAKFMALYNRRLVKLAKKKIAAGKYGNKNLEERFLVKGSFTPGPQTMKLMFQGIRIWLLAELKFAFVKPSSAFIEEPSTVTPLPQAGDYKQA